MNQENAEREKSDLLFGVRRSVRYHARRRRHFDWWSRITVACSLLFGSAAFAALLGFADKELGRLVAAIAAGVVTVASTIDLVFANAVRARDHHDIERKFCALEREILRCGAYDEPALREFQARRVLIEEDEEPPLRVLDTLCHNELIRAMGYEPEEEKRYSKKVGFFQRLFAQWFDLMPDSIR